MDKSTATKERLDELVAAARDVRERAYAPYSGFRVGASVLTTSGRIFTGCNVENVSFGLTVCAERAAITSAVANGDSEIAALAVVTEGPVVFPCGACLQVIQEFSGTESPVIVSATLGGQIETRLLSECLPCAFTSFDTEVRA